MPGGQLKNSVTPSHPLRVAVDGPPAAGKTTLADELALLLRGRGMCSRSSRYESLPVRKCGSILCVMI
jgi:hypothetical protein